MFPLFETIKIENKTIHNFELHKARIEESYLKLANKKIQFELRKNEILSFIKDDSCYKCNIEYNQKEFKIFTQKYLKRTITQLVLIEDDKLTYPLKFVNRNCFAKHLTFVKKNAEPLFVVKNKLTDSSFSNIALWNGEEWHTPKDALFKGIRRGLLLQANKIIEKDIFVDDLINYQKISFINAMLDLEELEINL